VRRKTGDEEELQEDSVQSAQRKTKTKAKAKYKVKLQYTTNPK
jgi:hypothetical protein